MKKLFGFILLTLLCLSPVAYAKKNQTMIGTIMGFECGDNCYLTIVDEQGKDHQALCGDDKVCEKMMTNMDDPDLGGYKRKLVKVTIGQGQQVDGAGTVMGTMDAFEHIELMK